MNAPSSMYAVILAGGSGTRFWPASRRLLPKQVLPLGPSAPHSLIASTVSRLAPLICAPEILVATGAHLVDVTRKELPSLDKSAFLAEPSAKNTAPAIAWATACVARRDPEAIVCVLPSDQHAADAEEFRRVLAQAAAAAAQSGRITTIGIVPTRPETGYGYIERGAPLTLSSADAAGTAENAAAFQVTRFVEKPDRQTAIQYLSAGNYLWNAGIFVFRAKDMLSAIERHLPELFRGLGAIEMASKLGAAEEERAVQAFFAEVESVSIDYGVMEKQGDLLVVPGDFGWSDLGSWESAWELSLKDVEANAAPAGTIFVDAKRNLVEDLRAPGQTKRVISLVGVSDLCVIETDDALLIMPRDRAQDVREVVAALKDTGRSDKI